MEEDYSITSIFISCVFLYLVCLVYLFRAKTQTYAWLLGFFLNLVFPTTMLFVVLDLVNSGQSGGVNSSYNKYLSGCVLISVIFEFVSLILTLIAQYGEDKLEKIINGYLLRFTELNTTKFTAKKLIALMHDPAFWDKKINDQINLVIEECIKK
jgi:hypothetical protein